MKKCPMCHRPWKIISEEDDEIRKMRVYFAHPCDLQDHPDKYRIVEELKSRNLEVVDPFDDSEKALIASYGLKDYWDDPNWTLARELWTKDLELIYSCDFLLAWLPDDVRGTGTAKEITYAYLTRRMYIQVISPRLHPAFAVEVNDQYLTIEDFIANRPHEWKILKNIKN